MILNIRVIPNAKCEKIKKYENGLRVYVTAPPEDGRANRALIKLLSKELNIPKSKIEIIKGERGREKIIKINR